MKVNAELAVDEIQRLRAAHYNASVSEFRHVHEDLGILRILPDQGTPSFLPGQYSVLGLGNWERRVAGCQPEDLTDSQLRKLLKRAYSFSCSMLDDQGHLLAPQQSPYLEFYIVLVRQGADHPPGLTPRLFELRSGDRLFTGPKVTGHYTLELVRPGDNVIFVATGTGEAPHNAMVAELLSAGHRGRLVSITCVRQKCDLAYLQTHRELEARFAHYRYLALTTREPENHDPSLPNYVGKRYLQDYFECGEFERACDLKLDPDYTHVFLCGNPAMIGARQAGEKKDGQRPKHKGMIEVLENRGFKADEKGSPGNIHFEKYW